MLSFVSIFIGQVVCPILLKTQTKLFNLHVTCRMASSSVYPHKEYLLPFHSMQCRSFLYNTIQYNTMFFILRG